MTQENEQSLHSSLCHVLVMQRLLPSLLLLCLSPLQLCMTANPNILVKWQMTVVVRLLLVAVLLFIHVIGLADLLAEDAYSSILTQVVILVSLAWLIVLLLVTKAKGMVRSAAACIFSLTFACSIGIDLFSPVSCEGLADPHQTANGILCLILLFFCSMADKYEVRKGDDAVTPRVVASFPSYITFSWVLTLARTGFQRVLTIGDMHPLLGENKAAYLGDLFSQQGNKSVGVTKAIWTSFKYKILLSALFHLTYVTCDLMSPVLMRMLLTHLSTPDDPQWFGFLVVVLMLVSSVTANIADSLYTDCTYTTGCRIRSGLSVRVYDKSLRIAHSVRSEASAGKILTLVSVDVEKFQPFFEFLHSPWSGLLYIFVCTYLMFREVGSTAYAIVLLLVLMIAVNFAIGKAIRSSRAAIMRHKDERVEGMSEILNGIKVIKVHAWEPAFMDRIDEVRVREMRETRKYTFLASSPSVAVFMTPTLATMLTFAVYVLSDPSHTLDPAKVFTILTIVNILIVPLTMYQYSIRYVADVVAAVRRLDQFLGAADQVDYVTRFSDPSAGHSVQHDVRLSQAVLCWEPVDRFRLTMDMQLVRGALVAVVGPVGSGKSALLSAILSDMHLLSGSVSMSREVRKVAYVPQEAWILNDSMRNNVLFGSDLDHNKYCMVMDCCQLLPDMDLLPAGDETEIGEKGINLSGGQKQRVSLARACYSDADLFLFDDPLSAVDAHVADRLMSRVFSSATGILRNKTRLLVTHNLSVLPQVDEVIVMSDGRVAESGTFDDLMAKGGVLAQVMQSGGTSGKFQSEDEAEASPVMTEVVESGKEVTEKEPATDMLSPKTMGETDSRDGVLVQEEKLEVDNVKLSVFVRYYKQIPMFGVIVFLFLTSQAFEMGSNYWVSRWSQDAHQASASASQLPLESRLSVRLSVYVLLTALTCGFMVMGSYLLARGGSFAAIAMHRNLLMSVMRAPISFFETTPIGRILNRFVKDMESMDSTLCLKTQKALLGFSKQISNVLLILTSVPYLVLGLLPLTAVFLLIQRYYVCSARQIRRWESTTRSQIYARFSESLAGVSSIRAYAASADLLSAFAGKVDQSQVCSVTFQDLTRWRVVSLSLIGTVTLVSTATYAVVGRGDMDTGLIGLALTYALQFSRTLNRTVRVASDLETEAVAVERVLEYTDMAGEAAWTMPAHRPPADWPSRGGIQFRDYSTRYRPGLDLSLTGLEAEIAAGEKIGVVGRTGAGKSTITLSLTRLMEAAAGRILIDGIDISSIGLHDLRSKVTVVSQDPFLFSGTLRHNLDPFAQRSDSDLWASLSAAHLSHFAAGLPLGLQHRVRSENLSLGQRQLLCLARALSHKTRIVMMDEATASVDPDTDSLIQQTIRTQFADCTVITIAHRLHTILDSDRVLVMDGGRIAELDTPTRLLADHSSLFHALAAKAGLVDAHRSSSE